MVIGYNFYRWKYDNYYVQSVAPRKYTCMCRIPVIVHLCADLLDFGVIHAWEWSLKNRTNVFIYGFQGVFNANVFNVLAMHIESKMI